MQYKLIETKSKYSGEFKYHWKRKILFFWFSLFMPIENKIYDGYKNAYSTIEWHPIVFNTEDEAKSALHHINTPPIIYKGHKIFHVILESSEWLGYCCYDFSDDRGNHIDYPAMGSLNSCKEVIDAREEQQMNSKYKKETIYED